MIGENATVSADWMCPACKATQRKSDNSGTPVKSVGELQVPTANGTTAKTVAPPSVPAGDTEVAALRRDLADYMTEQRQFRDEIRESLAALRGRMTGLEQRLDAVEKKAAEAEAMSGGEAVVELQETVSRLQQELQDRDQDALLSDLDIGHIPESRGENVVHIVTVLATKLGVALDSRDIVFAERVGAVGRNRDGAGDDGVVRDGTVGDGAVGRPRRIVVRLTRRQLRDEMLQAARVRRTFTTADADLPGPPRRVYLNERLTRTNRQLFQRVRGECRKQLWRFAWTKRGRVYARQADGKQAYHIRSDVDCDRVFGVKMV